jgi:hypothetical protein
VFSGGMNHGDSSYYFHAKYGTSLILNTGMCHDRQAEVLFGLVVDRDIVVNLQLELYAHAQL